jgi:hypothetical protein
VEKMGVGSSREPRDIMMPSGSSERFISEFFDIAFDITITSLMRTCKADAGPR